MMELTTRELATNVKALAQTMKYASRPSRGILLDAAADRLRSLEAENARLQESVWEMRDAMTKARVLISIYADGSMAKKITNDLDDLLVKYPNAQPKE